MANDGIYVFKGAGSIETAWVSRFFALFRQCRVNIRKFVLLQQDRPGCFSLLEVHFTPLAEADAQRDFLAQFQQHLTLQAWQEQRLHHAP